MKSKKVDNSQSSGLKHKTTVGDVIIIAVLLLITVASFIPFWHIIVCSFASASDIANDMFLLIPKSFSLDTMKYIFSTETFPKALLNSVYITLVGTAIALVMTSLMAYPLSQKKLLFRNQLMFVIVLTMVFHPGMIPAFLNIRDLGLYDSTWSLIIPAAIGTYNLILVKNYYQSLPQELSESAKIDGATDFVIFYKIFFPLSKPILATVGLFYAVQYWNNYISAILYIDDSTKWPIQVLLRNIVMLAQTDLGSEASAGSNAVVDVQALQSATIFVSTLPILCVYPFVQKYFVKGIMLGSVKG